MKQIGFIVYSDYETKEDKTYIYLYGRLTNGHSFVVEKSFFPYFFIKKEDEKKIQGDLKGFDAKIERTSEKTFSGKECLKIVFKNYEKQKEFLKLLNSLKIETFEADLKPNTRFLIDNDIFSRIELYGDYKTDSEQRVDRFYIEPEIKKFSSEEKTKLKVLSLDIETSERGELYCVSLYSKNYQKSFIISKEKIKNAQNYEKEEKLLEDLKKEIISFDPDIITGWNLIDFDLFYLKEIFKKNKILFDIGRKEKEEAKIRIEKNFFKNSTAEIPGRIALDGLNLIKDPFIQESPLIKSIKAESYSLEDVSQAILGKGKTISFKKNKHKEIEELYKKNKEKLIDYNLNDCVLVYEILEKAKIIDLEIERSELTGLQLNKLTGSIAAFDSLYIREARKRNLVSPTTKYNQKEEKIKGGYVMTPKPGIYENVLTFDFKSLYPSIIKTFNIDPASFIEKPEKNCIVSPNGACFKNQEGILPEILGKLHEAREKAKKEKRELSNYAIKIIMNSFFGVLASPNCRYFDLRMANAITHFGQEIIKMTAKKVEEKGFEVLYGDTDSIFVHTKLNKEEAIKLAEKLPKEINSFYEKYVKEKFNRKSFLELEFDSFYLSLIIPQMRAQEETRGAKKRYAGLIEKNGKEELEIVGLEAIRGDWTEAAKNFQKELLIKIFKKENPIPFIKEHIKKLKEGKLDKELVYRKSIRKELEEYTKTTPPHVKAARQLDSLESNLIEYYITTNGPEPIQKLKHKIDYEHYVEKQIKPIAKTILETSGINFEKAFNEEKQEKLF
ncbi:MAG: DNA polymerase II [Candidatus Pacearchaeota archaeon]